MTTSAASIAYEKFIPDLLQNLGAIHGQMAEFGLEKKLFCLMELRASQINQCAFCVKMHTREAKEAGETSQRLERITVWRHVDDFTAAEKAVLAWTEALTVLDSTADYGPYRADLKEHFTEEQISVLTTSIAMINLWNRIQVSKH
ncbi:MAG: carboxymuconolactone decarboxylase family protein [Roseibium sp.]